MLLAFGPIDHHETEAIETSMAGWLVTSQFRTANTMHIR
jgi:hypothetical protein